MRHPKGARSIGIGHPRSGDRCADTYLDPLDPLRVAVQIFPFPAPPLRSSHSPGKLDSAIPLRGRGSRLRCPLPILHDEMTGYCATPMRRHPLSTPCAGITISLIIAILALYIIICREAVSNMGQIKNDSNLIIYQDDDGLVRVSARFADEDVWLTQGQLAEIYNTTQQNIAQHIKNIYADGELADSATHKKYLLVKQEGSRSVRRNIDHYNLDMIISLGYRVQSQVATRFRRWATELLHEYVQKGFAMDDDRLREGGNRYFKELLQRIRDIRASERNFYQQVTDIYSTSVDYDPRAPLTRTFFATVQNKLHFAVHEHTAAEVIYDRVDSNKPLVGMTNFKGDYITKDDVKIAKNYLTEMELKRLNLLVSQVLDFAEFQALEERPMRMADWIEALDSQLLALKREVLEGNGKVSHKNAIEKAEREFSIYRQREMAQLQSDFDKMVKQLPNKEKKNPENSL